MTFHITEARRWDVPFAFSWVSDDGASWKQANDGLAMLRISVVAFDPNTPGRLVVGTGGRGFYLGDWR